MLTIKDVEDAILQAKVRFNKAHSQIVQDYMAPYNDLTKAMLMDALRPEVKEQLNQRIPAAMRELNNRFSRKE